MGAADAAALKLLASFAHYVQQEDPGLALKLGELAIEWAKNNQIPIDELLNAMAQADD